jgi:hypothetical protein
MAGIILDPSLLGIEGQTYEGKDAVVRLNGVQIPKCIGAVTGAGHTVNGAAYGWALGSRRPVYLTKGTIEPSEFTVSVMYHASTILKQIISPLGRFLDDVWSLEIQFDNPGSGIPGLASLLTLPTITMSWEQCQIVKTGMPIEIGGSAQIEEWTVKALIFNDPAGVGAS